MARILLIETSASTLSVALAQDGVVLTERVCSEPRRQASLTAPLVKEVLDASGFRLSDCDAVAVSSGPGSYTGLRVGVSTAKGLCFGASLPLIAIGTLDILVAGCPVGAGRDVMADSDRPSFMVAGHDGCDDGCAVMADPDRPSFMVAGHDGCVAGRDVMADPDRPSFMVAGHDGCDDGCAVMADSDRPSFIVPMIDARRMEVYTAVYNTGGERITPIEAKIVEAGAYDGYLSRGKVLFVGDGAMKCREVIGHPNAFFMASEPLASNMAPLAEAAFRAGRFEDVAYFEPFYLKDFVATVSRKNLL